MSYRFRKGQKVEKGFRRIAGEQVESAIDDLRHASDHVNESVHEVRKRCKEIRGLLRLVRPELGDSYTRLNAWFRDAARSISDTRDAQAMVEALDELLDDHGEGLDPELRERVREQMRQRAHDWTHARDDLSEDLDELSADFQQMHCRIDQWKLDDSGFSALRGGWKKTYKRARKAMRRVRENPDDNTQWHEWRKRVKYHWYHTRLLRKSWKSTLKPRARELKHLSDLLGDDHDLYVLRTTLLTEQDRFGGPESLEPLFDLIADRRRTLQEQALRCGRSLLDRKPKDWLRQLRRKWKKWRK